MKKDEILKANHHGPNQNGTETLKDDSGRESLLPPRDPKHQENNGTPEGNGREERVQNSNSGIQENELPKSDKDLHDNRSVPMPNTNRGDESGRELDDTDHDHDYKNPMAGKEESHGQEQGSDGDSNADTGAND